MKDQSATNTIEEQISDLDNQLAHLGRENPEREPLLIARGGLYWRLQDWARCLNDYQEAISLNPTSEACHLREMCMQIIEFYNKDMLNP